MKPLLVITVAERVEHYDSLNELYERSEQLKENNISFVAWKDRKVIAIYFEETQQ